MSVPAGSNLIPGKVLLVGAGPGDANLLTFRARQCLQHCDTVLYDYLANPQILSLANPSADLICLGKHGVGKIWTQDQINQKMVELARQGQIVVRLKGGDPLVFGRAGEEIAALNQNGIQFEIVPGITAAIATAAYCGLPLTHRDLSSSLVLVTAARKDGHYKNDDFKYLAKFPGTIAVYMGTTTVEYWADQLLQHGKSANTPVLIVRHATTNKQSVIQCDLGNLAQTVIGPPRLRPPAMFLIGDMAHHENRKDWFMNRPLFGQTVLVTRPSNQSGDAVTKLEELGANVVTCPMIEIRATESNAHIKASLEKLSSYRWIVLTSANGVTHFMDLLFQNGLDARAMGAAKIAVIGNSTRKALEKYHLNADLVPEQFNSESLTDHLISNTTNGDSILLVRGNRSRNVLQKKLTESGRTVTEMVVYISADVETPDTEVDTMLRSGQIDWVTLTSPAIARNFIRLYGDSASQTKIATISPITSAALKDGGKTPDAQAIEHTFDGLINAMKNSNTQ